MRTGNDAGGAGMRWAAGGWIVAGVCVLAACGGSAGAPAAGRSATPSGGTAPRTAGTSSRTGGTSPRPSAAASSAGPGPSAAGGCLGGRVEVVVRPGDGTGRRLCVRPGAVVSLVLGARSDDRRWTAVRSSAPAFVVVSGWRVGADGTGYATLRCAGARGGAARVTVSAKAPDVAGAAGVAFTLDVRVVPYGREG
ncbi:hypothetical protein AB0M32_04650 [Streptomyces sp. NPDC051985]|uniref:hypothetical protein n=1 Tax=Streptomyces sp. NPDC051985 TaxID=3155807 RepID=UPI00342DF20A